MGGCVALLTWADASHLLTCMCTLGAGRVCELTGMRPPFGPRKRLALQRRPKESAGARGNCALQGAPRLPQQQNRRWRWRCGQQQLGALRQWVVCPAGADDRGRRLPPVATPTPIRRRRCRMKKQSAPVRVCVGSGEAAFDVGCVTVSPRRRASTSPERKRSGRGCRRSLGCCFACVCPAGRICGATEPSGSTGLCCVLRRFQRGGQVQQCPRSFVVVLD